MEEYGRVAQEEIQRQWGKGINPALYNGHHYWKNAWWTKPNPEGVSTKDAVQAFLAWLIIFSVCVAGWFFVRWLKNDF